VHDPFGNQDLAVGQMARRIAIPDERRVNASKAITSCVFTRNFQAIRSVQPWIHMRRFCVRILT